MGILTLSHLTRVIKKKKKHYCDKKEMWGYENEEEN